MTPDELRSLLTDTLDDHRLSRAEKRALSSRLDGVSLSEADQVLCQRVAFELAQKAIDATNSRPVLEWLDDVTNVLRRASDESSDDHAADACFSPGDACWTRITGLLKTSRHSVDICVFTVTDDRVTSEILDTHARGVTVRLISDNDKANDPGSDTERLARAGVPVRIDRTSNHMHHKFALFDNARLLTGSYNWTRSAAQHNEENLIVTGDPRLVGPFQHEFDKLWDSFDPF
ncbi:MAG: phospholipase D-like domain-containing protein [Planctomycetota bacterium]